MLYEPSESELKEELHAAFKLFEKDGKGVVHTVDMKSILHSLGIKMSTNQIQALVKREGKHDHKTLTLQEFSAVVRSVVRCRTLVHRDEEVGHVKVADAYVWLLFAQLFQIFDIESSGHISLASLKQATVELGGVVRYICTTNLFGRR